MAIRVLISGSGNMGREVLAAATREPDLEPAGVVDFFAQEDHISLPDGEGLLPFGSDAAAIIARTRPDVVVDFTNAEWTPALTNAAIAAGVRPVIGTSGLPDGFVGELAKSCEKAKLGGVIASNFALGAILMQYMAKTAARFFDSAEIIELHHDGKVDAPSGTSIATAKLMAEARGKPFERAKTERENMPGTRGGEIDGITIHSVRLPGHVAHQEVIFGGPGETLQVRHNSMDRISFMPGVVLAVREVMKVDHLVIGLDRLIGLGE
jgi:4-hydroxy-tetrahydrodipicolinate reductase